MGIFFRTSAYNCDRLQTYLSEDDFEDDFIVDDEENDPHESDFIEDENSMKAKTMKHRKIRNKKSQFSSSDSSSSENSEEPIQKPVKLNKLLISESESSTESSDIELNVSAKKAKMILKSESEEEKEEKGESEVKILPKRRNKERERKQRAAEILRIKRELVQTKLPLDRRRYIEKELDEESLSDIADQLEEDVEIFGINDSNVENKEGGLDMRDSDKEFIASSSEDEQQELEVEEEFKHCLENLRNSKGHLNETVSLKHDENISSNVKHETKVDKKLKFRRVVLDYNSDEDIDDKNLARLFKQIYDPNCDINVIRDLILKHKGILECVDSHGRNPLHVASIVGNTPAVEAILALGANVNALDRKNMPSIAYAAYWKHPKVGKYFTNHSMNERKINSLK